MLKINIPETFPRRPGDVSMFAVGLRSHELSAEISGVARNAAVELLIPLKWEIKRKKISLTSNFRRHSGWKTFQGRDNACEIKYLCKSIRVFVFFRFSGSVNIFVSINYPLLTIYFLSRCTFLAYRARFISDSREHVTFAEIFFIKIHDPRLVSIADADWISDSWWDFWRARQMEASCIGTVNHFKGSIWL